MRELGLETAGGNPGTLPSSSRMSAVSSEARRRGWGVLNQVLRPWTSCGCCASATKRRHSRTKQPQSFGKNRVHGCSLLGGIPWVAITTACPWFQPKVCLGLYTELEEGDTPSLTPAESPPATFSSSETMDPRTAARTCLLVTTDKHEPNP